MGIVMEAVAGLAYPSEEFPQSLAGELALVWALVMLNEATAR
jgi:hypothetical protein